MKNALHATRSAALASLLATSACLGTSSGATPGGGAGADAGGPPDAAASADGGAALPDAASSADASVVVDCPAPTGGPTVHEGDVVGEETWTAAGSPHIVHSDVNVRDGARLTIEPCAEVQVEKDRRVSVAAPLTPNTGTLIAEGTAQHPIRFTGKDGARWGNLYVRAPGTARLRYVTLEGGGSSDGSDDGTTVHASGDAVLPADPTLLVDHVTIRGSTGTGLWMEGGATFLPTSSALVVTGSGSDASPFPVRIEEHSMDAMPTGTFTGNKIDEIRLRTYGDGVAGDGLTVDATLHDRGVPYRIDGSFYIGSLGRPLATMTIEAGVVMKFEAGKSLYVQKYTGDQPAAAAIVANGTAARPVVFTSASPTPQAGDWGAIWFGGALDAKNHLDHVRIEYAGADCLCSLLSCSDITSSSGAVLLTHPPAGAFITNSELVGIAGHAVMEGFEGNLVDFRPTNTFAAIGGCVQTLPRAKSPLTCPVPSPACDGL